MLTRIRNRQKGFTLIELLIVIAIIGIIAALLIPNFLDAMQKAKQKRTMGDMRNIGTAMFSWMTDTGGAAAAGASSTPATIDLGDFTDSDQAGVAAVLVPQYTNIVPVNDGWKNEIDYWLNTTGAVTQNVAAIRSPGRDGGDSGDTYTSGGFDPTDYDQDIVWADGFFVRWPQRTGATAP